MDPFIMGMTQAAGTLTPLKDAAAAVAIAASSNNVVKGIYAFSLADRKTGVQEFGDAAGAGRVGTCSAVLAGVKNGPVIGIKGHQDIC